MKTAVPKYRILLEFTSERQEKEPYVLKWTSNDGMAFLFAGIGGKSFTISRRRLLRLLVTGEAKVSSIGHQPGMEAALIC